jgi:hypothetical protein
MNTSKWLIVALLFANPVSAADLSLPCPIPCEDSAGPDCVSLCKQRLKRMQQANQKAKREIHGINSDARARSNNRAVPTGSGN